jgi:hypothetical protein
MMWVLAVIGAVPLGVVGWLAHHVRRELLRRRRIARVRGVLALNNRVTVAELRRRCDADNLPRYPTPGNGISDPDLIPLPGFTLGSNPGRAA